MKINAGKMLKIDRDHAWHPYASMKDPLPVHPVESASGVRIRLAGGRELIDGMSSWWTAIHGYNHPVLNDAAVKQMKSMAHVMFGGLTHAPAAELASLLVELAPAPLDIVFFSDSGSVSVEVAMKMAVQYWRAEGRPKKTKFLALSSGYHGDTLNAMSVSDPVTGMHGLFSEILPKNLFADAPGCGFGDKCAESDIRSLRNLLETRGDDVAAVILEPVVQGAGGMRFYSPEYLKRARALCDFHGVLLIADEIATGFGRTGKLFACNHAEIAPDIMCLGKAMTGGYITLAATLTTKKISDAISTAEPRAFMHGPTFMANPLACAVSLASIRLLLSYPHEKQIKNIEKGLIDGLGPALSLSGVKDVRVLGAIGVVEMESPVNMESITKRFIDRGVWMRPFGRLVYTMPPYIIDDTDLSHLTSAIIETIKEEEK